MGRTYAETVDQAKFAARFDMVTARRNVPSFDKLCRDFDRIVTAFLDPQP
jgi:hypothetical protein